MYLSLTYLLSTTMTTYLLSLARDFDDLEVIVTNNICIPIQNINVIIVLEVSVSHFELMTFSFPPLNT
jgi:hypothetical protein